MPVYVTCPVTTTNPAPSPAFTAATGLGANVPCGLEVEIVKPAAVMECRCPRGHTFLLQPTDLDALTKEVEGDSSTLVALN